MSGKKILIVTYYWPPSGGVGVQRWLHFAINLKKMGWEPIVYTPENPQFELQDENLEKLVADIQVIKQPIWEPFNLFHRLTGNNNKGKVKQGLVLEKTKKSLKDKIIVWIRGNILIPDPRRFWVKPSIKLLKKVISDQQIDYIVTTGPPHSMHLIGLGLKKGLPDLQWIADFRDPWSDWDVLPKLRTSKLALFMHRKWEKQVLSACNLSLTVSPSLAHQLSENSKVKVALVYNGVEVKPFNTKKINEDKRKFRVGYFGLLNELRDPDALWSALRSISNENFEFSEQLELVFGGIISDSIIDKLKSKDFFNGKVSELGYLSHEKVFEAYQECDLLVLLLNKSDNAKWILPQKFFEYLTAGKPILAIGPDESDLSVVMVDHSIGKYVNHNDVDSLSNFILSTFEGNFQFDNESAQRLLDNFSRESQAKTLVGLIEKL